jgi:hypothetical protein
LAALNEAEDEIEEELSARAKGAVGGGLVLEVTGGLNGLGISLIPLSLPEVSFGLEAGLGGGTMVPIERGVVGLADNDEVSEAEEDESRDGPKRGSQASKSLVPFSMDEADGFDFVNSSFDEFRFICTGLCLDIAGDSVMFPIDTFNSSKEATV